MTLFWTKVEKTPDCWFWTAAKDSDGYGSIGVQRRIISAHKVAWEMVNGPVPDGLELDHLCRNRACVRPDHMEAVTHRENMLRGGGVGSLNAAKTVCDAGHAFDAANTYIRPNGHRDCRACIRERARRYSARKKAA